MPSATFATTGCLETGAIGYNSISMLTNRDPSKVTQQEIADALGVSRQLVSHALHGTRSSRISAETRHEIRQQARLMGYVPPNRTTHTIGYVAPLDLQMLAGESRFMVFMGQALRKAGYRLMLQDMSGSDAESLRDVLSAKSVDGVIFSSWMNGDVKNLLAPEIPWLVVADDNGIPPEVDVVTLDTLQSTEILAGHLLSAGHKRLCLISGAGGSGFHERAKAGVRTALAQAELPESNLTVIEVAFNTQIGSPLLKAMQGPNPPTAVIGIGVERVIAAMNHLSRAGYLMPEDVSIVSLLDHWLLEPLVPAITTTTAAGPEAAETVVQRLLEKIESPDSAPRQILVPAQLVERASVAPPRIT